jgi:CMP-N-acetylneuraminic acid synthetase
VINNPSRRTPKVLGLITARGGSKGVKDKNIIHVGGKPLIYYTIEAARRSALLDDCILSTDSRKIAEISAGFGAKVPFIRPAEFATDAARSVDAALHALDAYDPEGRFDYLLLLQPTSPFRTGEDIDKCIELAAEHDADSVITFCDAGSHHPYYTYFVEERAEGGPPKVIQAFDYEVGTPRQEFPPAAYRNGAVYLVRVSHLKKARSFVTDDIVPYFMPVDRSVSINYESDVKYIEFLMSSGQLSPP